MKERDETLERWIDCPKCGNEEVVVITDYRSMANDTFDHQFQIKVECDECESTHCHTPLYTEANTRRITDPHGSHSGGPIGGVR